MNDNQKIHEKGEAPQRGGAQKQKTWTPQQQNSDTDSSSNAITQVLEQARFKTSGGANIRASARVYVPFVESHRSQMALVNIFAYR